jgi:hypothetical protein
MTLLLLGAGGSSSSLLTGLQSYWKMNDAANGTRLDSLGLNSLSDVAGNVGSAAALLGNGASYTGGATQSLQAADSASLRVSGSKWFGGWVKFTDVSTRRTLLNKDAFPGTREYLLEMQTAASAIMWNMGFTGGFQSVLSSAPNMTTGVWTRMDAWYDASAKVLKLSVNNQAVPDIADVSAAGTPLTGTQPIEFGNFTAASTGRMSGLLDEWGMWNRIPTATELTRLYNAGVGVTYPQF